MFKAVDKSNKPMAKGVVYVIGVPLNTNGRLIDELKKVYGISTHSIKVMIHKCGLLQSTKLYKVSRANLRVIERLLDESHVVGPDLRRKEYENIQRHRQLGTYKGIRIRSGLPVHGQRTSTNAKTAAKLNKQRCKM